MSIFSPIRTNTLSTHQHFKIIAQWLFVCAALIFILALIGAATRLSESGLSITEWRPITGVLPPLTEADWDQAFALYKATPEYAQKNMNMTISEFQTIFYWEWAHRLGGRLIGFFFLIPFIGFLIAGWIRWRLAFILLAIFALGGLQGKIGWFMVQSGLVDHPTVSPYRLALHLLCAMLLYSSILWLAFSLWARTSLSRPSIPCRPASWSLYFHTIIVLCALIITIIWGAFVAGLDAGMIYNEFPTMGTGHLVPVEMWHLTPPWLNFFENHASVQFTHRWLAISTILLILSLGVHGVLSHDTSARLFGSLAIFSLIQGGLGIATLLSGVNIYLAVMHQGGAFILLGLLVATLHRLSDPAYRSDP